MAFIKVKGAEIRGIVTVVPSKIADNLSLEIIPMEERAQIVQHTGIRFRRIAAADTEVKDLFEHAAIELMKRLQWDKNEIDVLVCVTQTAKVAIPSVACQLHGKLDLTPNTLCFDINSGCSGFVYGLQNVSAILQGIDRPKAKAILLCGDISSSLTEKSDRTVLPVFSDAVSAIAVEMSVDKETVTGYFNLETDGQGKDAISTSEGEDGKQYMRLNGIDIFNFSVKHVPRNIRELMTFAQKDHDFPALYVFHQANKLINESIRKKLALESEKVPYSLYEYGNTASASIPLTLGTHWKRENHKSDWIVVSGFGVGFSMASALIKFNPEVCTLPIEIN